VYSSHFFEHIEDDLAEHLLRESYRVLEPGGIIRLTTPDFETMLNKCRDNDVNWWRSVGNWRHRSYWDHQGLEQSMENTLVHYYCNYHDTKLKMLSIPHFSRETIRNNAENMSVEEFSNWCVSNIPKENVQLEHINWWTHSKFTTFLEKCSFKNIKKVDCYATNIPYNVEKHIHDPFRAKGCIFVEAQK